MKPTEFIVETSQIAQEADDMHADHEVQMARSDCYSAAKYAIELHRMLKEISEQQGLDGWVSEKITLANDYLRTVHEYLMHEMAHGQEQAMMGFTAEAAEYAFDQLLSEDQVLGELSKDTLKSYVPKRIEKTRGLAQTDYKKAQRIIKKDLPRAMGKLKDPVYGKEGVEESGHNNHHLSKKDTEDWRLIVKDFDDIMNSDAEGRQISQNSTKRRLKTKPMAGPKGTLPESGAVIAEMTSGASGSSGVAISMGGPGYKPTSGVPKKVKNAHKPKKITVGKGVY